MSGMTSTSRDILARASVAEAKINATHDGQAALDAAVSAIDLYMQALKIVDDPTEAKRLKAKTKSLFARAEGLKASLNRVREQSVTSHGRHRAIVNEPEPTRKLTTRENIILLEGSKLNGTIFRPWQGAPSQQEFDLQTGHEPWTDGFDFALSQTQLKHFAGWLRPNEALAKIRILKDGQLLPNQATMASLGVRDMVQDVAPDCSVVASLCVGTARAEKGHRKLFRSILWPYDHGLDQPAMSTNGKYVLRFYFNGCWRRVEVDDRLPTSNSKRVLHVLDRSHPGLLWPIIAEKAYLKVRGGYDFPGSNSGTDIAVLTGWIPQQIFLHDDDIDRDALWNELYDAFCAGEILCTLGTGKLSRREQQQLGLGEEHDYAILDMKMHGENQDLLIKNPWADGEVWKGAKRCRPNPGHEVVAESPTLDNCEVDSDMRPGTFWMDFNHLFQHFEHMYVNWDPRLFVHREDYHFSWQMNGSEAPANLLVDNPQFALRASKNGDVLVWLNRHFRTGDFSVKNHGKNGYVGLYMFENNGGRVFSNESVHVRGHLVDSPNTLIRFRARAHETYTLVPVCQAMPTGKHNFTLSTFSNTSIQLSEAFSAYQPALTLSSAWTRSTAKGSAASSEYLDNPQFALHLDAESRCALVLKTVDNEADEQSAKFHVKLLVLTSDGGRATKLRQRDVKAHSGDYKRGSAVIIADLDKGSYSVVCSTFEPDQRSKFELSCFTSLPSANVKFSLLPAEGAGRFKTTGPPAVFANGVTRLIAPVAVPMLTRAFWKTSLSSGPSSSLFKISIQQGKGPYCQVIASTSETEDSFDTIGAGLRIEDVNLRATAKSVDTDGLWLEIQRPTQLSSPSADVVVISVEAFSEERLTIGDWQVVHGL